MAAPAADGRLCAGRLNCLSAAPLTLGGLASARGRRNLPRSQVLEPRDNRSHVRNRRNDTSRESRLVVTTSSYTPQLVACGRYVTTEMCRNRNRQGASAAGREMRAHARRGGEWGARRGGGWRLKPSTRWFQRMRSQGEMGATSVVFLRHFTRTPSLGNTLDRKLASGDPLLGEAPAVGW